MIKTDVVIGNKRGLHARATAKLVALSSQFKSDIILVKGTQRANAKSIMGVMMLAASKGTTLVLEVDGEDEHDAHHAVIALIDEGFDEFE